MDLSGRGILVTGGSLGLGRAVAAACVAAGADVLLAARSPEHLDAAVAELAAPASPEQVISGRAADVSRPDDVAALVAAATELPQGLAGVVNSAGVQGPIGPLDTLDWEQWTQTIAINLLGTVAVCRAAIPHLRARGGGKIVNLSGGGVSAPFPRFSAYASSKGAVVVFTQTLAAELAADGIDVNAVAPGALATRMLEQSIDAGATATGGDFHERMLGVREDGGASIERAAALCAYLCSSDSDGVSGRLISAVWDPWETLGEHAGALAGSDLMTMRRVAPEDRPDVLG